MNREDKPLVASFFQISKSTRPSARNRERLIEEAFDHDRGEAADGG
jgi:hypothetical protein